MPDPIKLVPSAYLPRRALGTLGRGIDPLRNRYVGGYDSEMALYGRSAYNQVPNQYSIS
jgi:hypothetical protein